MLRSAFECWSQKPPCLMLVLVLVLMLVVVLRQTVLP
jgi:hypothetical protein